MTQGVFPYAGLKLGCYQVLTNLFYKDEFSSRSNNSVNFFLGAMAGAFAVTLSFPTDFVRRNYQVSVMVDN